MNADGLIDNRGTTTHNMFAYCVNNPVMCCDLTGTTAGVITFGVQQDDEEGGDNAFSFAYGIYLLVTTIIPGLAVAHESASSQANSESFSDTKESSVTNSRPPTKYHIHHIVAQNDCRAKRSFKILVDVGIDPRKSPLNLVRLPAKFHSSMHTNAYYKYIESRLLEVEGNRVGVIVTLILLKVEIRKQVALTGM